MNMQVEYLGLKLKSPFMPGGSPLMDNLDMVRRYEDAGVSAIVLRSLFEEQIVMEERAFHHHVNSHEGAFAEASHGFLPSTTDFAFDTEQYLEHVQRVKKAVKVPVIASLNGITHGGWERYARLIEEAGADALELNFYDLPTDPHQTSLQVEERYIEILKSIRAMVKIPLSAKLSAWFSSLPNFATKLSESGAQGLVLFNRLFQPDIDIEELQVRPSFRYSDPSELALRIRWLAVLEPVFGGTLAVSGGVHTAHDAIKAIMAGASAVQMVSTLLKHGPTYVTQIEQEVRAWLEEHEYTSLTQMRGSMSLRRCPDPAAFGRANYLRVLHGWDVREDILRG